MGNRARFSPEVKERAVRLFFDQRPKYDTEWAAMSSIAEKIGCVPETLRSWVRQAQRDGGQRAGLTTSERERMKELERENLRDHMTDLELIFSMLGEAATTEITRTQDAQGFDENRTAAQKGGRIAGGAREKLEKETRKKVVTPENYLKISQKEKKRLPKSKKFLTE